MKVIRIINFLGLLFMLLMNFLANALPLNGITTGQISNAIPALFTPAGYVFSIWGIIFLGMIGFGLYQLLPSQKENQRIQAMGYWFAVSSLLNGIWIVFWHYGQIALSVLVMLGLLFSLIMVYTRSRIGLEHPPLRERWLLDIPFGIYLGWISVATIANISALGVVGGWGSNGTAEFWTVLMIGVAGVLAVAMMWRRNDIAYPMVVAWALIGIYVARQDYPMIASTAAVTAVVIFVFLLILLAGLLAKDETPYN